MVSDDFKLPNLARNAKKSAENGRFRQEQRFNCRLFFSFPCRVDTFNPDNILNKNDNIHKN